MKLFIRFALAVSLFACMGDPPAIDRVAPANDAPAPSATAVDSSLSLRDVVMTDLPVGRMVRLTGRCLTMVPAFDRPAGAEQLWQLEAGGLTVVVSGAPPRKCLTSKNTATVTITAIVAEDTLPPIADLPPTPRRFLLLIGGNSR